MQKPSRVSSGTCITSAPAAPAGAVHIDILIALEEPPRMDLFDLVNLEDHLSQLLGADVDIAIKESLRRRIGQRILSEVVPV